jgi:hypothetical protein
MAKVSDISINWNDEQLREDLIIAKEIDDGKWGDLVQYEMKSISEPITFIVGRTKIWKAVIGRGFGGVGYQIADLNEGFYLNHRGFSSSARKTIKKVIDEVYLCTP